MTKCQHVVMLCIDGRMESVLYVLTQSLITLLIYNDSELLSLVEHNRTEHTVDFRIEHDTYCHVLLHIRHLSVLHCLTN